MKLVSNKIVLILFSIALREAYAPDTCSYCVNKKCKSVNNDFILAKNCECSFLYVQNPCTKDANVCAQKLCQKTSDMCIQIDESNCKCFPKSIVCSVSTVMINGTSSSQVNSDSGLIVGIIVVSLIVGLSCFLCVLPLVVITCSQIFLKKNSSPEDTISLVIARTESQQPTDQISTINLRSSDQPINYNQAIETASIKTIEEKLPSYLEVLKKNSENTDQI